MASDKQITANRANALKSTGPRSLSGRARSSQNAIKHGLTAQHVVLPGENPEEFEGMRHAMFGSLNPQGALENQLVERAASLIWRMRRISVFEMAVFEWSAHYQAQKYDSSDDPINAPDVDLRNDQFPCNENQSDDLTDVLKVGRMFESLLSSDITGKLSRYETSMQRQLSMTLKELREFKAERLNISELVEKAIEEEKATKEQEQRDTFEEEYRGDLIGPHGGIGPP